MGKAQIVLGLVSALAGATQLDLTLAVSARNGECFEYGYSYQGYDVYQAPFVGSPSSCMSQCAAHRGCGFWTYDTQTRVCYLKSAGAVTGRFPSSAMVSGPKQCTFSQNCFEVGVDYYGYDIEKIEGRYVMTPQDCQRLCTGNPQCAFFSWKQKSHACYLKSASAILARREDPDVTSGPRSCANPGGGPPHAGDFPMEFDPNTAPQPCVESSVEYRGYNVKTARTRSAAACQRECQQMPECHYWTWSSQSNLCSLKNQNAPSGRTENAFTLDKVSGARDCIPVIPGCQFANVSVIGARLSTRHTKSFDICQLFCAMFSGCTHFSHDLITSECTLWSSFNAYAQGSSTEGIVSGPAFCDAEDVCYEQSDYVGNNVDEIETGEVTSPAACQNLCRNNDECYYWTWLRDSNHCYLKDANAISGRSNDVTSLGRYSGPKYCTTKSGCLAINGVYVGASFEQEEVDDYKGCAAACSSSPFCTAWTYHTAFKFCSLFSGEVSLASMPVRGTLSGDKECISSTDDDEGCFDEGIAYDLDSIVGMFEAQTAFECYARCQASTNCRWWTLKNYETCYLLSAEQQPFFVFDPNSISGPSSCPGDNCLYRTGFALSGGIVAQHQTYTPAACMKKCEQTPKCLNWQFTPGESGNNCLLQDSTGKLVEGRPHEVSGELPPMTFVTTDCTFSDPVGSVTVDTHEECRTECQYNKQCEGWQTKPSDNKGLFGLTCTLFRSARTPRSVKYSKTKCGSKLSVDNLRTMAWVNVADSDLVIFSEKVNNMLECYTKCTEFQDCSMWLYDGFKKCYCYQQSPAMLTKDSPNVAGTITRPTPAVLFNTSYIPAGQQQQPLNKRLASRLRNAFKRRLAPKTSSAQPAETVNDCIDVCSKDASCTAWSFKEGSCSLFNAAAIPIYDIGAISGRRSTPPLKWTFELEKKFTGEPVKTLPGEGDTEAPKNAMECAAKASEGQCWSYKRGREETICQLYTNCSSTEEAEGFVSGKPLEGEDEIEEDEDDGDY